jgi:hypothetical protein
MTRAIVLVCAAGLLVGIVPVLGSPVSGPYREPQRQGRKASKLEVGSPYEFKDIFRANQRASVIVEGDHNPVMNLTLKVFDPAGNLVAADTAGGDMVAVSWYPPRTQEYRISISGDGQEFNALEIFVK